MAVNVLHSMQSHNWSSFCPVKSVLPFESTSLSTLFCSVKISSFPLKKTHIVFFLAVNHPSNRFLLYSFSLSGVSFLKFDSWNWTHFWGDTSNMLISCLSYSEHEFSGNTANRTLVFSSYLTLMLTLILMKSQIHFLLTINLVLVQPELVKCIFWNSIAQFYKYVFLDFMLPGLFLSLLHLVLASLLSSASLWTAARLDISILFM